MKPVRSEKEIIGTWKGDKNQPVVSICCVTYNHATFIEDAITGFLEQETDFPFEIIIHDDASTDGTTELIKEYAKSHPTIIRLILQQNNQYSQGKRTSAIAIKSARSPLICFCEGDDYWISNNKLQTQVDLLSNEPNMSICFHPAKIVSDSDNTALYEYGYYGEYQQRLSCAEVIRKGGGYMPMASIMLRRTVIDRLEIEAPDFLAHNMTHFFYQVFGAMPNGALYSPKTMSIYRSMHQGSWSYKAKTDYRFQINASNKYITSIEQANKISGEQYDTEFTRAISKRILSTLGDIEVPQRERHAFYLKYKPRLEPFDKMQWHCIFRSKFTHSLALFLKKYYHGQLTIRKKPK